MISQLIKNKLGKEITERVTKVSYIQYQDGHKNSRGEPAPWVVLSHKDSKVLSSHKTKNEAQQHLKDMRVHAAFMPRSKEIEIIVWLRQQKNLDKQQLLDFAEETFNLSPYDADRLILEALPNTLDANETKLLEEIDKTYTYIPQHKKLIDDIFSIHLDNAPLSILQQYDIEMLDDMPSTINNVCYYLLKKRKLI